MAISPTSPAIKPVSVCGWFATGAGFNRASALRRDALSGEDAIFIALTTIDRFSLPPQLFDDLLNAFVQDVGTTLFHLGRRARLLPPIGESGRPAGVAAERLSRRSARCGVRRGLHGIAADQFLAGPGDRLVTRALVCPRGDVASASCGGHVARCAPDDVAVEGRAGGLRRPHTRELFQRGRPVCDDVSGRLRYKLPPGWAACGFSIVSIAAALRCVQVAAETRASDALVIAWETLLWREAPPSPSFVVLPA